MRYLTLFFVSVMFLAGEMALVSASNPTITQSQNSAQEKAASLRAQLADIETKQAELQTRLQKLDEDMKSENIANSLALVGSTHPEDLREQRRRQLEIERNGVQAQLNLLATSHTRLETSIAQADADAYRQSAAPVTIAPVNVSPTTSSSATAAEPANAATIPKRPRRIRKRKARSVRR
jgi:hypothetical protein